MAEEQVAEATPAEVAETAKTIAEVSQEIDATAESLAALDAPMMFAQAGGAAAGGAAAGGISTAAIVAGVAVVGVAAASGGSSSSGVAVTPVTPGTPAAAVGNSITLTAGNDLADENSATRSGLTSDFVFTTRNDTVNATSSTLTAGDILIDASTTDTDVLNVNLVGTAGTATVSNIETINANMLSGTPILDLTNVTGATRINVSGSVAGTIQGLNAQLESPTIALNGYTRILTVTAANPTGTTAASTAETLNFAVSGGTFGTTAATQSQITIDSAADANAFEVVNLSSDGTAANTLALVSNGDSITRLNLTGTQDLNLRVAHALVTGVTVDGSGNSAATNLVIDRNGATTAATNATNFSGVDKLTFRDSTAGTDTIVVANLAAGTAVDIVSSFAVTGGSIGVFGAASNTADVLALTLDNATASTSTTIGVTNGRVDIQNVETLNITSNGNNTATLGNGNVAWLIGDARTVNITGDTTLSLGITVDNPTAAATTTITAAGLTTGVATIGATIVATAGGANNRFDITGSSSADGITGSAQADTIDGGAGNDAITGSAGGDRIVLGAGNDTYLITTGSVAVASADAATITDFVNGTGTTADIFSIDVSETIGANGAIVANLANYVEGTAAAIVAANNTLHVITDTAYASGALGIAAVEARNAASLDGGALFLNSATGFAELWLFDDSTAASDFVRVAVFENITTLAQVASFDAANFTFA